MQLSSDPAEEVISAPLGPEAVWPPRRRRGWRRHREQNEGRCQPSDHGSAVCCQGCRRRWGGTGRRLAFRPEVGATRRLPGSPRSCCRCGRSELGRRSPWGRTSPTQCHRATDRQLHSRRPSRWRRRRTPVQRRRRRPPPPKAWPRPSPAKLPTMLPLASQTRGGQQEPVSPTPPCTAHVLAQQLNAVVGFQEDPKAPSQGCTRAGPRQWQLIQMSLVDARGRQSAGSTKAGGCSSRHYRTSCATAHRPL
mmetsp:Transcript_114387/g.356230  ORF Transcript_114387/g.356230 Transcript_114387/m.356230 type:complete len:250 (-) Transcript_114387:30-779(-)